jgi:hypothetical protein
MIKTYVTPLELQYLFDNQLVSNFFIYWFLCTVYWHGNTNYYIFTKYVWVMIYIIYDDYLITYYTCKLNFIGKITTYYNHNQIWF